MTKRENTILATITSASLFGIMGTRVGTTSHEGTYLFLGVRTLSAYTDFTTHAADAEALGLYTP